MKIGEDEARKIHDELQPAMTPDGMVSEELLVRLLERTFERQGLNEPVRVEKFFDFSHTKEVKTELEKQKWNPER
jgi:hypothetical protein